MMTDTKDTPKPQASAREVYQRVIQKVAEEIWQQRPTKITVTVPERAK